MAKALADMLGTSTVAGGIGAACAGLFALALNANLWPLTALLVGTIVFCAVFIVHGAYPLLKHLGII